MDDTVDIKHVEGFLAPHRPGPTPTSAVVDLRAKEFSRVKRGMSPEKVAQILGRPDDSFEQNTAQTGYQRTVFYALPGARTAFLWFDAEDRLSYQYPRHRASEPVHIEVVNRRGYEPEPTRAIDPAPDPPEIRINDMIVVRPHTTMRRSRSTVYTPWELYLRVVDVRGDQIGCLLRYREGDAAVAWVASHSWWDRSNVAQTLTHGRPLVRFSHATTCHGNR